MMNLFCEVKMLEGYSVSIDDKNRNLIDYYGNKVPQAVLKQYSNYTRKKPKVKMDWSLTMYMFLLNVTDKIELSDQQKKSKNVIVVFQLMPSTFFLSKLE